MPRSISFSSLAIPATATPAQSLAACKGAGLVAVQSGPVVVAVLGLSLATGGPCAVTGLQEPSGVVAVLGAGVHGGTVAPVTSVVVAAVAGTRAAMLARARRHAATLAAALAGRPSAFAPPGAAPQPEVGASQLALSV